MAFLLDCSVTMSWCFESEKDSYSEWLFSILDTVETILVPGIWALEVVNVLVVGERRKRLSQSESTQFLGLLDRLPIEVDTRSSELAMSEVLSIARISGTSAYDASYLELAMRKNLPLATLDGGLTRAAMELGVRVMAPKHQDA